jgi:hypothetical protein|tara:strand:- start:96 stop:1316 length:1221 start_codon:yes stop_codon:yes gene_type:complete
MSFWDVEDAKPEFIFEDEKRKLIENMDYLMTMTVEEQTLYKKWVALQEDSMIRDKPHISTLYDTQWKPTDINNKEQTIKEIDELDPYIEIVEDDAAAGTKWTYLRRMIHTMSWTANPGRNVKIFIKDRTSGKLLGLVSLASDVTSMGVRDNYIGWKKEDKFVNGKLNYTTIASTIVCTQPLGYNFLGGKLTAMMTTVPEVREFWKRKYGQTLIAVGTTSLYGIHSQYNGIPHFKTLGESAGKISLKPDDEFYEPWHQWIKQNRAEWYEKAITNERIRNGKSMGTGKGASGPVSGIKQKILGQIFKECGIKQSAYHHGFKRGVYLAMMYENGPEFLRSEIEESELVMKKKFVEGQENINKWWKRQATKRYSKLHDAGKLKTEHLFYLDGIGTTWEEFKAQRLSEVGR